jgi:DnaK suppressor protein
MTTAKIRYNRQQLLALKKRLGDDLTELEEEALRGVGGEASGGLSDVPIHPADLGTENHEEEVSLGLLENEDQILAEVNDALERIEQGTFGRCENCGQEISRERLKALPYARYCVRCAQRLEGEARGES